MKCGVNISVGLVAIHGTEEMRVAVGRRLGGADRNSHMVLGDGEDSPLQDESSKRSSMCNCYCFFFEV